jgi:pre-rRNA-processing protein TSR1
MEDAEGDGGAAAGVVLSSHVPDPSKQQSLQSEVVPDPLDGEQTWPTDEELNEASTTAAAAAMEKKTVVRRVPKGTSDYQAAWIVDSENEEDGEEDEDDDEDEVCKML